MVWRGQYNEDDNGSDSDNENGNGLGGDDGRSESRGARDWTAGIGGKGVSAVASLLFSCQVDGEVAPKLDAAKGQPGPRPVLLPTAC